MFDRFETYQIIGFIVGSAFFVYVSRHMLMRPHVHGFYRFFAWECMLALILLNLPHWGANPLSYHQIISWLFLLISIYLVVHGVHLLKAVGKPDPARPEVDLLAFEKTSRLVTVGLYKYIRHPLYASLMFLAWGAFLKLPSLPGLLLVLTSTIMLFLTAKKDEAECLKYFGEAYQTYMQRSKMFIPFLF
jgi:protein-S-isoprenylcysteine O-methyltransferase Ste14